MRVAVMMTGIDMMTGIKIEIDVMRVAVMMTGIDMMTGIKTEVGMMTGIKTEVGMKTEIKRGVDMMTGIRKEVDIVKEIRKRREVGLIQLIATRIKVKIGTKLKNRHQPIKLCMENPPNLHLSPLLRPLEFLARVVSTQTWSRLVLGRQAPGAPGPTAL